MPKKNMFNRIPILLLTGNHYLWLPRHIEIKHKTKTFVAQLKQIISSDPVKPSDINPNFDVKIIIVILKQLFSQAINYTCTWYTFICVQKCDVILGQNLSLVT